MSSADEGHEANPLLAVLRARIAREGPIAVDAYMRICQSHPEHGYWRSAESIGAGGDFITAPEISQVFGELIGLWCAVAWQSMGSPALLRLIELGPGRGTLMRDALRAARAVPSFLAAVAVHLIETSIPLRQSQRQALGSGDIAIDWHSEIEQVPEGPAIVIANEFLDALPIRQLVLADGAWRERMVAVDAHGTLQFAIGPQVTGGIEELDTAPQRSGTIVELRAGEDELLARFASRASPVVALFVDYGPALAAAGDTLQAVRRHAWVDPLSRPGRTDLTAHVQFARLADKARAAGLAADGPMTQAEFLGRLGIAERAARLMAANPREAAGIEAGVQRLISPTGVGELFKVLAIRSPDLPTTVPFARSHSAR